MTASLIRIFVLFALLPSLSSSAQEKKPTRLMLRVEEESAGPFGGERSASCLKVYSDGRVLYSSWRRSGVTIQDQASGKNSRPEKTVSVEYHLEPGDEWELDSFLHSKAVRKLPTKFGPPHTAIDYSERVTVRIEGPNGTEKSISTREFYVASLQEKSKYPSALILLMDKIDEVEKEANEKGKPTSISDDCHPKPQDN